MPQWPAPPSVPNHPPASTSLSGSFSRWFAHGKWRRVNFCALHLPESARYGVLFDPAGWRTFIDAVKGADVVTHAFIVTNSTSVFQQIVRELPTNVEPVRLYENYLSSFEINTGDMS